MKTLQAKAPYVLAVTFTIIVHIVYCGNWNLLGIITYDAFVFGCSLIMFEIMSV